VGVSIEVLSRDVNKVPNASRYYAHFRYVERKQGVCLASDSGNGDTPHEAVRDYVRQISGQPLVIRKGRKDEMRITCPQLTCRLEG
jgi:hypothetical protein